METSFRLIFSNVREQRVFDTTYENCGIKYGLMIETVDAIRNGALDKYRNIVAGNYKRFNHSIGNPDNDRAAVTMESLRRLEKNSTTWDR